MEFFGTINSVYVLLGSLMLGASGGLLGAFAVLRKQGMLGDALAHASLPGIAVAFLILQSKFLPGLLLGALVSGLLGAFFIYFLVKFTKIKMDTAMASVLSVFFGIGILLLTYIQKLPLASQSGLETFLFGQAAALLKADVIAMGIAFIVIVLMLVVFWKELKLFVFDGEFARVLGFKSGILEFIFMTIFVAAILMSLQAVGVVLTAALFITPAAAALLWSQRLVWVVVLSAVFGMLAGGFGAMFSAGFAKVPTGPMIVLFSTAIFLVSFFFAPEKGVFHQWLLFKRRGAKVRRENFLAALYREREAGLKICLDFDKVFAGKMEKKGLIVFEGDGVRLSNSGLKEASGVIEKHRLWETYLVNKLKLPLDHVHRDAEEIEHILTDELVVELKKMLKNPKKDPHGKLIK